MKPFVTIVPLAVLVLASATLAQPLGHFGWTISNSTTDALSNRGPAEAAYSGSNLYLWLECARPGEDNFWTAAEFGFDVGGAGPPLGPANGANGHSVTNPWPELQMLPPVGGCGDATTVIMTAVITCPSNTGAKMQDFNVCFRAAAVAGSIGYPATVDCGNNPTQIFWTGFANGPSADCNSDPSLCAPDSVDDASWGSVKGLYR